MNRDDEQRLAVWMDSHGLPGAGEPLCTDSIAGGASNEIVAVRRGGHRMVLRRPPAELPPGRETVMRREFRVLDALNDTPVAHPRALGLCEDGDVLGSIFYLMEQVDGWSPMNTDGWPAPFDSDRDARRGLAFALIDGIAELSRVDWRARGLEGFGRPDGFHERQVDRWLAHLATFAFRDIPGLDTAAAWLRGHRPRRYEPGIMHGDYQFANVMFRHGAPARLAAIVDWEMATVGDPLLDLAWVLMGWPNPGERVGGMGYVDYDGMPSRAELVERYASVSGRSVDDIDYYLVLARFKMAIVLEGGYARVVSGEATNEKMETFGPIVLEMAAKAADLAAMSA